MNAPAVGAAEVKWGTRVRRALRRNRSAQAGLIIVLALLLLAVIGPSVVEHDPYKMAVANRLKPPSATHWLGTDEFGRDLLARIAHGARATLSVGLVSVVIAGGVGTLVGLLAGYFGGRTDTVISGVIDVMLAFPGFLLALAIAATLGPSLPNVMIAMGIRRIPVFARVVRAEVAALKGREYVEAARAIGAGDAHVLARHVLRNIVPTLAVLATLQFPEAILTAAGLSFLGLGAQPPEPEWGALLVSARQYMFRAPWLVYYPGIAIVLAVLGFNLLGNAVRDLIDPRLKGQ